MKSGKVATPVFCSSGIIYTACTWLNCTTIWTWSYYSSMDMNNKRLYPIACGRNGRGWGYASIRVDWNYRTGRWRTSRKNPQCPVVQFQCIPVRPSVCLVFNWLCRLKRAVLKRPLLLKRNNIGHGLDAEIFSEVSDFTVVGSWHPIKL